MDDFTEKLSVHPEAEQCGWIKDKYGLSWQISAAEMGDMFEKGSKEQIRMATQALMEMKRIDLNKLRSAFAGTH